MERTWAFSVFSVLLPDCGTVLVDFWVLLSVLSFSCHSLLPASRNLLPLAEAFTFSLVSGNEGFEDSGVTLINGRGAWGRKELIWLAVEPLNAENVELSGESTTMDRRFSNTSA
ncbi:hypothetical protein F5B21DRAFT_506889 [Xylaria acuta]|nr:hypothetical protein F5B21DRAFT_506889 [Xylaria acuta]